MTTTAATPILFLKAGCPHCLKVRLFLLEAGLADRFEQREFTPGDDQEAAIRTELAPHFGKVSFPTVKLESGEYLNESDSIVDHYAALFGVDPAQLPIFTTYAKTVLPKYSATRRENAQLKDQLPQANISAG